MTIPKGRMRTKKLSDPNSFLIIANDELIAMLHPSIAFFSPLWTVFFQAPVFFHLSQMLRQQISSSSIGSRANKIQKDRWKCLVCGLVCGSLLLVRRFCLFFLHSLSLLRRPLIDDFMPLIQFFPLSLSKLSRSCEEILP